MGLWGVNKLGGLFDFRNKIIIKNIQIGGK